MKRLFIIEREGLALKYGVGTYIRQLIDCFDLNEWQLTVVQLLAWTKEFEEEEKEGILYYRIPAYKEKIYSKKNYERGIFYLVTNRISSGDLVFCHFHFVYEVELARLFRERFGAKIVLTLHFMGWSFELLGDRGRFMDILNQPANQNEREILEDFDREKHFMIEYCDRVIAIAKHSYDTLRTLYQIPEKTLSYIPNGLKDEYIERSELEKQRLRKKYGFNEQERLVIFAGRLNEVKGIQELLCAFKCVQKDFPDVRLIVAGDEGFRMCFQAASPCWGKVIFTGLISRKVLFELYAIAEVGIVPSIHEEFGYVAVEMMMNYLPLIVGDTTGLREVTGEGKYALLVDMSKSGSRVENLKESLIKWLSEDKSIDQGRQRFEEEYNLEKFKQNIKQLYVSIK